MSFLNIGSIDFAEIRKTVAFQTGTNVRSCGCIELVDDQVLELSEAFEIMATINDPILTSTGSLSASVIIADTTDSKLSACLHGHCTVTVFLPE